jgi:hypothetical protein
MAHIPSIPLSSPLQLVRYGYRVLTTRQSLLGCWRTEVEGLEAARHPTMEVDTKMTRASQIEGVALSTRMGWCPFNFVGARGFSQRRLMCSLAKVLRVVPVRAALRWTRS